MIGKGSSLVALADSPPIDHQEIMNHNTNWTPIEVPQKGTSIPDGRRIYYNTANNITNCTGDNQGIDIFGTLPNITSVSYFSNGNTLDATFWLSKVPLINHSWQDKSQLSKVTQVLLLIEHSNAPSINNSGWEGLIENERTRIEQRYPNTEFVNSTRISNSTAQILFNGTVTHDSTLGNRSVIGYDKFTIKDNKFNRMLYFADNARDFITYKSDAEKIGELYINLSDDQAKDRRTLQKGQLYDITGKSWGFHELSKTKVLFFSPIDFYFMGTAYVILVDVPSSYDGPTDFIAKLVWWHKFPEPRNWAKIIEEASTGGPTRTLEADYNFKEFFKKKENWEAYAFIPINLRTINSPNEYLMVFLAGATYILDGLLCEMVQNTDTVSSPPPKLSIIPLSNSTSIDPSYDPLIDPPYDPYYDSLIDLNSSRSQEKQIEVMVKSFSDIPYTISFKNHNTSKIVSTSFSPPSIKIPPSGWNTTQLKIKAEWKPGLNDNTVIETIPIDATPSQNYTEGTYFSFENKALNINRSAAVSRIEGSALTITAFNWPDYIMNIMNALRSPVSVLVPLAGVVGGIFAWFLKREKDKKETPKESS